MELITIGTKQWQRIEKLLKSDKNNWRGKSYEKRIFIAGVIYLLKQKEKYKMSRLNWKSLPEHYGNCHSQERKFVRWKNDGTWLKILPELIEQFPFVGKFGVYELLLKDGKTIGSINSAIAKEIEKENDIRIKKSTMKVKEKAAKLCNKYKIEVEKDKQKTINEIIANKNKKYNDLLEGHNKLAKKSAEQHDEIIEYHRKYGKLI